MQKDSIKDWYKIMGGKVTKGAEDKTFKKHYIKRNMMIGMIGPTGVGKSTILVEFLHRSSGRFTEIVIFTGSTSAEPLLLGLREMMPGISIIDDVEELPLLSDEEVDVKNEKLIVFDDFINLNAKELKQIQKWFNSARKYGWSCIALAQDLISIPKQLRRNIMIWLVFRLRDARAANYLLNITNVTNIPIELLKEAYLSSTKEPKNFFKIDMTENNNNYRYSHNFLDFFHF
jgi:hypothetical protein